MADEDVNDDGSGEDGDKDKVDVGALAETVQGLVAAVGGINTNMQTLTQSLQGMADRGAAPADDGDDDDDAGREDTDLEGMSRTDFANHMLGRMEKTVKDAIKPVTEKVGQVESGVSEREAAIMLKEARKDNTDFDEWIPEVKAQMQEAPGLSLKRALKLAQGEDPEKVKKMRVKYKMDDPDEGGPRSKGKDGKFGGLTPGSSKTKSSTRMSKDEAGNAAWEAGLAKLEDPSILNGET